MGRVLISRDDCAGIAFQDLYLGATVNVYSRELIIIDYGDDFTKRQLEQKKEKTLALIKPDAFLKMGKVWIPSPLPLLLLSPKPRDPSRMPAAEPGR